MSEFWEGWRSFWNSEGLGEFVALMVFIGILAVVVCGVAGIVTAWEYGWRPWKKS